MAKKSGASRKITATHQNSIDFQGMLNWLPNPDPILKEMAQNQKLFEVIMADSHMSAVIAHRKAGCKSMLWDIDRGKAKSRTAKAVKDSLENINVYSTINDALEAPYWGLAPLEINWKSMDTNGRKLISPESIVGKPSEWFSYDSENNLRYISKQNPTVGELVPDRTFIEVRYNDSYKNPYGDPIYSKCYWPVIFKKAGWKFWVMFMEKYANQLVVARVQKSGQDNEYQKIADQLVDMIQDSVMVVPDTTEVEALTMDRSGSSGVFKDLVTFSNQEITKAVLGSTLTVEASDTGTQALGTVHRSVDLDIINEDRRMVEDAFNQYIKWFVFMNFGETKDLPKFTMYHEEEIDLKLSERDKTLSDTGQVKFTQQYIERAYGYEKGDVIVTDPEDEPEEKKEFAESKFQDQVAVDALVDSFGPKDLMAQSGFIMPILDLGNKSDSFEEFKKGLINIFPDVRPEEFEEKFRDVNFVTQVWGNINGGEN